MLLYISYLSAMMGTWCKAFGKRAPVVTFGEYAERLGAMLGDVADVVGRAIHPTAGFIFMSDPSKAHLKLDKHIRGTDRALEAIARIQDIELLRGEIKYWPVWKSPWVIIPRNIAWTSPPRHRADRCRRKHVASMAWVPEFDFHTGGSDSTRAPTPSPS